ncbi:MAG: hypothetical protein AB1721_00275 [Patescibacteria group bacterium]
MEEEGKPRINNLRTLRNSILIATKLFVGICFAFVIIGGLPSLARAATLYFSPAFGSYPVSSNLNLSVYVSSPDESINAVSGIVSFPSDKLEVISLSKTGSIINLWVQEPNYSNSTGQINFEGVILNPGYTGAAGKIISLQLRAKNPGLSLVNFSSGSVLANDGLGTNVLTSLGRAELNLQGATAPSGPGEIDTPSVNPSTPAAPEIVSKTHPDPNKWYANANPEFSWQLTKDATAIRLLYDNYSRSVPSVVYQPPISEKSLSEIKDGVYYFHAQQKNSNGWGGISHFRFQIDTVAPELSAEFLGSKEKSSPRPKLKLAGSDSLSGIDYFLITIDAQEGLKVPAEELDNGVYQFPVLAPGENGILIQVFDRAGNLTSLAEKIYVEPIALPIITDYPKELEAGQAMVIKGGSLPGAKVVFKFEKGGQVLGEQAVQADPFGNFVFVYHDKVESGVYRFSAKTVDSDGAESFYTEPVAIAVSPGTFSRMGLFLVNAFGVVAAIVSLLAVCLISFWYLKHKLSVWRLNLAKEVKEVESVLAKEFYRLQLEVQKQIKVLEQAKTKRELTKEETELIEKLKLHLAMAEKTVKKEIQDIKDKIS